MCSGNFKSDVVHYHGLDKSGELGMTFRLHFSDFAGQRVES